MRVCFDNIIYFLQRSGGISKYWFELTCRFAQSGDHRYVEYSGESGNMFRSGLEIPDSAIIRDRIRPLKLARYMPVASCTAGCDIFHSSYYRFPFDKNIINIVTVYDFIYEYYTSGLKQKVHSMQKEAAVKRAGGIICISENTKRDLLKFYPYVDPDSVSVVYVGVDSGFHPLGEDRDALKESLGLDLNTKYAVFVGSREGYKNFGTAVKAAAMAGMGLSLVGGGDLSADEKSLLDRYMHGRYVHFINGVDTEKLNRIYNASFCLLYPSSYEGFGMPPAEAMRAGCIPVTSDTSSLPEVVGDGGLMCYGKEPECYAEMISRLNSPELRADITEKALEQGKKFTWDKCFAETLTVYEKI